jgi:hypothetical protein
VSASAHPVGDTPWYPVVRDLSDRLVADAAGSVRAVLLYGSHLLATNPDRHSAFDFVVVVDSYRDFYAGLRSSGEMRRWVWLMSGVAKVLPPNVIAYVPAAGELGIAKCLIVSKPHLERALGPEPRDHFLLGRLVQKVGRVWVRSPEDDEWLDRLTSGAHRGVLDWMSPYLTEPVDGAGLGRRLLQVCYSGEVRPEARNRADAIAAAQAGHFRDVFDPVLEDAERAGRMVRSGEQYALAEVASPQVVRRWRWHFRRSKVRATSRWFKHIVTFDNWLPYVVRKAERHSGTKIELTPLETRWPLLFLWPRVFRFLRSRPPREITR